MLSLTERFSTVTERAIRAGLLSPGARGMDAAAILYQLSEVRHDGNVYAAQRELATLPDDARSPGLFPLSHDYAPERALPCAVVYVLEWEACREPHDVQGRHDPYGAACQACEPTSSDYADALAGAEVYAVDTVDDIADMLRRYAAGGESDDGLSWRVVSWSHDGIVRETTLTLYGVTPGEVHPLTV